MKTDLYSISKIFTERLLRIPDYQRGYAWTEKQLKDFWNDLIQLANDKNHYTGVLTLEDVPLANLSNWHEDHWIIDAKSYTPHYVVDGQQRLTTAIILIQTITEAVNFDCEINYTSIQEIKKKFIYDSKDGGISRSYIFGYDKDNPSYEFLKTKIFLEASESSYTIQETIYTHNLENAKTFFSKKLEGLRFEDIEVLYKKLTQHLLFNIYSISDDVDTFVAFETMNNRGKPLSHLELLKNRLIYLSTKLDEETVERERLRHAINEGWKSIYHYLGKNKLKPLDDDLFLANHFILYFGDALIKEEAFSYSRLRRYYGEEGIDSYYSKYLLETKFTARNLIKVDDSPEPLTVREIYDYVASLKQSVELWYQILNPKDSNFTDDTKTWLERLNRLGVSTVAPLILVFFQTENSPNLRTKFLRSLESLLFLNLLGSGYPYSYSLVRRNYNETAAKLRKGELSPSKVTQGIEADAEVLRKHTEFLNNIKKDFRNRGFYSWRGVRYFLYEYEQYLQSKSKTHRSKLNWDEYIQESEDFDTVEHIYPQNARKQCWGQAFVDFSYKERNVLKHSLGNLVPLSRGKNSSLQNKCFSEKIGSNEGAIGFRYGSFAENELTKHTDWTAKEILDRGIRLLEFMETRWKVNIGDKDAKANFLGLEFVLDKVKD